MKSKSGFPIVWSALLSAWLLLSHSFCFGQVRVEAARGAADASAAGRAITSPRSEVATPGATGERAPRMEGDEEYGIQRILYKRSNWEPWDVRFGLGVNYTSNVALVDDGAQDDVFLESGFSASFTPQIKGGWFGNVDVSSRIFRYSDADFFDFDLLRTDAGLIYAFPEQGTAYDPVLGNLLVHAGYGYYRIAEPWDWGENNFDNHSVVVGAVKTWKFTRGHQLSAGVNGDFSFEASEEGPRRNEYAMFATYRIKWTESLETALGYIGAWYDYSLAGRDDFNQTVSLGCEYKITDWLLLNAAVSGTFNQSDRSVFDYKAFTPGISASVVLRW